MTEHHNIQPQYCTIVRSFVGYKLTGIVSFNESRDFSLYDRISMPEILLNIQINVNINHLIYQIWKYKAVLSKKEVIPFPPYRITVCYFHALYY